MTANLLGTLIGTGIFLVVVAGTVSLAWWLVVRVSAARGHGPAGLFASLCQAHGLSSSDRRLLRRLAQWRGLADPARLFVEPRHFEGPVANPALNGQSDRLAALRQQLFGG